MNTSCIRSIGLAVLALFVSSKIHAQSFTGTTLVDFNARGYANYDVYLYADTVGGGNDYAEASASFGPLSSFSWSYWSEAGVSMQVNNIHKVGSQWIADSATIWTFTNALGAYESASYTNVVMPSSSWIQGYAYCAGYTMPVHGWINGYGTPANTPPVPSISVNGRSSGDSVPVGTTVTINYGATDADGNLNGIRYNILPPSGVLDNGGGAYAPQSGGSGTVVRTVTLSTEGDWYFWTDARDAVNATASTPTYGSGFKITAYINSTTYCTPAYEPWYWNDWGTIQYNNNCYNYSNNRRTDTFAQPGRASGNMYVNVNVAEVSAGAISDGLEPTDATSISPEGKTKLAMVIDPDPYWPDFHWYRLDSNGYWTHKPGQTPATNLDNSGQPITDPETADRGSYTIFGGYFFTPSDCTQGQGHANIL
ncbi:MAG: hypothetical protein QM715_17860 [Nibricoccus sp.]